MRLKETKQDHWQYALTDLERNILEAILERYPVLDPGYQQISRYMDSEDTRETQELLEECMSDQQKESKKFVNQILMDGSRHLFEVGDHAWEFHLSSEERESLLQILNDIRVGFWLELGSPEETSPNSSDQLTPEEESKWALFQFTGYFQSNLLYDPELHEDPDDEIDEEDDDDEENYNDDPPQFL